MNEQTEQLIRDLAAKLGTTAEHLWAVLIRQAPISAATDVIIDLCIAAGMCALFLFVRRRTLARFRSEAEMAALQAHYNEEAKQEQERWPGLTPPRRVANLIASPEWTDEGAVIAWLIVAGFTLLAVIGIASSATGIIAGFFNPEYWALKQIIH